MKKQSLLFIVLLVCANYLFAQKKFKVNGVVFQTYTYCGGAEPMPEVLVELARPRPIIGKTIYIKKGNSNSGKSKVIAKLVTDSVGGFSINLPKGNYCIVDENKTKPLTIPKNNQVMKHDVKCLTEQFQKCDFSLNVLNKEVADIQIIYHEYCSWAKPCIHYSGPLPPGVSR